ncbi:type VI secretion system tube protein Hcp [Vibrio mytili]|uniref:type VI secretion system tube protein Hcp n=1 Tax=Vibrio mytili TaxID=50718 RepID=UPI000695C6E5|nr:type VI secretion system tube protein Hcp [Vibrio mytili]
MSIRKKSILIVASALITVSMTASAKVEGPMMMTIENIGTSEVLAWSWGASNSSSFYVGGGGGAGKANVQDVSLTRYSDAQSSQILKYVVTGEHLDKIVLERDGLRIELKDTLISSFSVGDSSNVGKSNRSNDAQTENLSLAFKQITYEVDGSPAYCYDVSTNTTC